MTSEPQYLESTMRILEQGDILRIRDGVITAGVFWPMQRRALLAGINLFCVAALPDGPFIQNALQRVHADIETLNLAGKLGDGTVPLAIWLDNAQRLAGSAPGAEILREAVVACRDAVVHVLAPPAIVSWASEPSPVLKSWRSVAAVGDGLLEERELLTVLDAVTNADLVGHYGSSALLGAVAATTLTGIPRGDTFISQTAFDVRHLNQRALGGRPLLRWLTNASVLCKPKPERAILLEAVDALMLRMAAVERDPEWHPPLATTVSDLIHMAARLYTRGDRHNVFRGVAEITIASLTLCESSALAQALSDFYDLFQLSAPSGSEAPFISWLRGVRSVAGLSSRGALARKIRALEIEKRWPS